MVLYPTLLTLQHIYQKHIVVNALQKTFHQYFLNIYKIMFLNFKNTLKIYHLNKS